MQHKDLITFHYRWIHMRAFIETNLYGAKTQWDTTLIDSTRTLLVGTELCNVSSRWSLTSVAPMGIRFLEAPVSSCINRLEALHGVVLEQTQMRQ